MHLTGRPPIPTLIHSSRRTIVALAALAAGMFLLLPCNAENPLDDSPRDLLFVPVKIDGPVHNPGQHTYWFGPFAECGTVLDINGDGKLDIAAGRNYYLAPQFTKFADY